MVAVPIHRIGWLAIGIDALARMASRSLLT